MILERIRLNPFAGLIDISLDFLPGLNVILGSNESGKSTLFNAIQKILFTKVNLTPSLFRREMQNFLPIGGGDTISVELSFGVNNQQYDVRRTWGGSQRTELTLPDGSIVTDDETLAVRMESLLPVKEGTCRSVLMTYQSRLAETLEDLKQDPESIHSLGNILRTAIYETDGISVEKFKDLIESEFKRYHSRWDRERECPEKEGQRFKINVGDILKAYYKQEDIEKNLKEASIYENELDDINSQIKECSDKSSVLEQYIQQYKDAIEDAKKRKYMENRLEIVTMKSRQYIKDNKDWPVAENQIENIEATLPELKRKIQSLEQEQTKADEYDNIKKLKDRFETLKGLKGGVHQREPYLKSIQTLGSDDLDSIRDAELDLERIRARVAANKIQLSFVPEIDMELSVKEGLNDERTEILKARGLLSLTADDIVKLNHPDWGITVTLGEGEITDLQEQYTQAKGIHQTLLEQHQVASLQEAEDIHICYGEHTRELEFAQTKFQDELGDDSYDILEEKARAVEDIPEPRSAESIVVELLKAKDNVEKKNDELRGHRDRINELVDEYGSNDLFLPKLAASLNEKLDLKNQLESLTPLPEEIEDTAGFIEEYEAKQKELWEEKDQFNEHLLRRSDIQRVEPENTVEELEKLKVEQEGNFKRVQGKGKAIGRIYDLTQELIADMDTDTYEGLEDKLGEHLSAITGGKYQDVSMEESLPTGVVRYDGNILPHNLLSAGTKDALALSLRLAMANYFLDEAEGFLILDDPLVDLDPQRQENAAGRLRDFSKHKQVLVFTCQSAHAELLNGHLIRLP